MQKRLFFSNVELASAAPRIYKANLTRYDVEAYDVDNGYPQRMLSMIQASPTAKSACDKLADFVLGQGFDKDMGVWDRVMNASGQTADEIFDLCAQDYSKFQNFALQFNFNALFQGVECNYVNYLTVRKGILEHEGQYALYNNWWNNDRFGTLFDQKRNIDWLDAFNPDQKTIKDQVRAAGGWNNYRGQLYVFNPEYTLSTIDSCLDDVDAEILAKRTAKNNIKNNFGDKVVWFQPGLNRAEIDAMDDTARARFDRQQSEWDTNMNSFVGTDSIQLVVQEYETEADKPSFGTIENKLDDKKFAFTVENARATIYRNFNQPAILHSDLTQGRYNQNQLPESFKYYNNITEKDRIKMQRAFKRTWGVIFPDLADEDFAITPLNDIVSATQNTEGANTNATNSNQDVSNQN